MDTREIAAQYRLAQWSKELQEKFSSGEKIEDFCQRKGISRNTYFYWQRKLRKTVALQASVAQGLVPNGWTQISEAKPETNAQNALTIEVGGYNITVSSQTDPELLVKVCRALRSL